MPTEPLTLEEIEAVVRTMREDGWSVLRAASRERLLASARYAARAKAVVEAVQRWASEDTGSEGDRAACDALLDTLVEFEREE